MSKAIPILVLDNTFTFGGAINSLYHLFRALDKSHFAPILVTGQSRSFLEEHFAGCCWYHYIPKLPWINNRKYRKLAALPLFRNRLLGKLLNLARFGYWFLFITIPEALKYYHLGRRHGVALVHLNNILGSQLSGILAAKLLRVPCVAHLRDFEEVHAITKCYACLIDHHVAISEAIRENLLQLGIPAERVSVVHDAIDLNEFNSAIDCSPLLQEFTLRPEQPCFGLFGRVVDWKGIREFLHAARHVIEIVPDARAFIVGGYSDGDEAFVRDMQQLAVALGVADKVIFTGYRSDVPVLMKLMDVVVHASNRPEPFGMVIIEGMAMGKPVVATRAGGPLDIVVDGECGYLVAMGDGVALGDTISTLLRDPELRQFMGAKGRERVEKVFDNGVYAAKMEQIFQHLLQG